jgi:hypothetical protein
MLEQSTSTDNKHVAHKYHGDFKLESQNASILWFPLRLVYNLKSEYAEPPLLRMQSRMEKSMDVWWRRAGNCVCEYVEKHLTKH